MLKSSILFIALFLLFISGVIYSVLYLLPSYEKKESVGGEIQQIKSGERYNQPFSENTATTKISEERKFKEAVVRYKNGGFLSQEVILGQDDYGADCLITVINESPKPLTIRLSPHTERTDWGAQYDAIPPQGELIIDPRFRIPKIAFHNHEKPSEEFSVNLGEPCTIF